MRDSYVADIGDFGKYALLNALAGNDLRLGVLWCRNSLRASVADSSVTRESDCLLPRLAKAQPCRSMPSQPRPAIPRRI
jgi:hypothetical protein